MPDFTVLNGYTVKDAYARAKADEAKSEVETATLYASEAYEIASEADSTAGGVYAMASEALSEADEAVANVSDAYSLASEAQSEAQSAADLATTASSYSGSRYIKYVTCTNNVTVEAGSYTSFTVAYTAESGWTPIAGYVHDANTGILLERIVISGNSITARVRSIRTSSNTGDVVLRILQRRN